MKTIKRLIPALAVAAALAAPAQQAEAQDYFWGVSYLTGLPTGDTSDYIDSFSWRGMGIDFRKLVSGNYSWGISAAWQVYHDREYTTETGTISIGEDPEDSVEVPGAISGTQLRYLNSFPFLATAFYTFGQRADPVRFYLGGGLGGAYTEHRTELGTIALESTNWHFAVAPEVGLTYELSMEAELYLKAQYNYMSESGGVGAQYFTFGIGVAAIAF